ncbi:MAG: ABC transporter substrate-binding protein [Candidatus Hermodarchaeota archaeon]
MNQNVPKSKKKSPKKVFKDLKKPIIGGSLVATFAIVGIFGGVFLWLGAIRERKDILKTSYEGLWYNDTLWDEWWGGIEAESSRIVISQIAEGLFKYDITEEYTDIIPNLALGGNWSPDGLNLTCQLRESVRFHDGTPFNATGVKWAFDRLQNLLDNMTYPDIWYHLDGKPILNRTEIIDIYIIRFILNRPFGPFKALLCRMDSFILSPSTAPLNDFIRVDTNLIGTGPFKYNSSTYSYDPILLNYYTENTTLVANTEYWDGPPKLKKIVFKYYAQPQDHIKRLEDMISGKIDYTYLWPWNAYNYSVDPRIKIICYNTPDIWFIWMKNNLINSTMRKAISYAINYTKMLVYEGSRWEGGVIRVRSPLSIGMLYSNWEDFDVPYYNLSFARQILKDVNWNETAGTLTANDNITAGNEWESLVNHGTPLAIYNYTYVVSSTIMNFYKDLLVENLKQIGVEINLIPAVGGPGGDFWDKIIWSHFIQLGWGPDFNDPTSNINPLFSNKADGFENWGNVNDSLVQQWMEEGLIESDETAREQLYYDIQKRLIEKVYPVIWTYSPLYCQVHGPNFRGIDYNLWPYIQLFKDAHF